MQSQPLPDERDPQGLDRPSPPPVFLCLAPAVLFRYLLATVTYGEFSWSGLATVALIGLFGFEAGFVLNDYIDREFDRKDVESGS